MAIEARHVRMRQIPVVAAEQFVTAIARQHDGHVFRCHLRHVPGWNRRHVGKRLVEVADQPIEDAESIRTQQMIAAATLESSLTQFMTRVKVSPGLACTPAATAAPGRML